MAKETPADMPWIGDNAKFPRVGDDGFDGFNFTSEQVETIHEEVREDTAIDVASGFIRALAQIDMDSDRDFLKAVRTAAELVV